jgi:glycosyltransferase involved in cell wall biosynthesis
MTNVDPREGSVNPRVSVIIPMYNAERWIIGTLASVQRQTYRNCHIIVIDDGSTDGSSAIVRILADSSETHVELVRTPNRGVSAARNLGISRATGDLIALLDADDVWLPNKLQSQVALLQQHPEAIAAGCSYTICNENLDSALKYVDVGWARQDILSWLLLESLGVLLPSTILMRLAAAHEVGPFDTRLSTAADLDYAWRLVSTGSVLAIHEPLVQYRTSANQMHRDTSLLERDYEVLLTKDPFDSDKHLATRASTNLRMLRAVRTWRIGRRSRALATLSRVAVEHPIYSMRALIREAVGL